jgi:sn-glycerol 3-phosphate transport system substrate-binding protein
MTALAPRRSAGSSAPRRSAVAIALAAVLALAGCNGDSQTGDPAQPPPASALPPCPVGALASATETVDVLLWYQLNGKPKDVLEAQVAKYNASHPKVRVRAESEGANYDELLDAYKRGIPSRQLPDIAMMEETATRYLVDSGTVVAAQKCFEADNLSTDGFNQAAVNYYEVGGVLYPGSASLSDLVTYYNKSHLRRAGLDPDKPPATLAEVRSYAERIRAAGVAQRPITLKLAPWFIETQLTGAHQELVDNSNGHGDGRTTKAMFETDTSRTIYRWIQDMVRDGLLNPKPDTPGQFDHLFAMADQSASMTIETSTAATTIAAYFQGDRSAAEDAGVSGSTNLTREDVGVGPVFGVTAPGKSQIGGNALFMTNTATDAEQAASWDFIKWWNQPEQQKIWHTQGSYLPFLTATAQDPEVQAFWRDDFAGQMLKVAYDELATGIDPAFSGPAIGPFRETRDAIRESLDRVALNNEPADESLRQAVSDVDRVLATYNEGL